MSLTSRKGGMVARIRISPKDCLAVLDIMQSVGINPYERSFSHCVSFALSSLVAVARKGGILAKDEDGFQYLNRMQPFFDQVSTKVKRELTDSMYQRAVHGLEAPRPGDFIPVREEFDREKYMEEYEGLKPLVATGEASAEVVDRFIYLQNKLY